MMSSLNISNIISFISLVVAQVLIFNNINFAGTINPYPYILFVLLYPANNNRTLFIFLSFLLGLVVDIFSDSGGVHAAASVFLAYVRPVFLKLSFGRLYEHQSIKFSNTELGRLITYITLGTLLHHFTMFSLEIFSLSGILLILKKALFSSIFTVLLSVLIIILFSQNKK